MRMRTITLVLIVVGVIGGLAWYSTTPAPFTLQVVSRPSSPPGQSEYIQSFAGQRCVFLVVVMEDEGWLQGSGGYGAAVNISATESSGMATITVHPQTIRPGYVAEITVIPSTASVNQTLIVTFTGERGGLKHTETMTVEVIMGEDGLGPHAIVMRDQFVPWLALNHPDLSITNETTWIGSIVNPRILVVMHYLFFSEDWELYVTWHVTIPPHDWTRIYLRPRFTESRPSYAFEISSVQGHDAPHAIEVPEWV
ncbi:hypothetical protein AC480_00415 [miscellaneous Crenarchaeota group archaeon SMTZ1-55]|nr:MAG: hypothetical protein AC480_00415 [miscellaneous Crenarchaeota group archaeon SMTZ1-55]